MFSIEKFSVGQIDISSNFDLCFSLDKILLENSLDQRHTFTVDTQGIHFEYLKIHLKSQNTNAKLWIRNDTSKSF